MTPQKDYRNRAAHVRRSARAHLKEIRRARLARKETASLPEVSSAEPEDILAPAMDQNSGQLNADFTEGERHPEDPDIQMAQEADAIENAALEELGDMFDDPAPAPEGVVTPPEDAIEQDRRPDDEDVHSDPVQSFDELEGSVVPVEAEPTAETSLEPTEQAQTEQPVKVDLEASDLNRLPGAGPGLVWMLHQCGVRSLADLAVSEPAELSPKLGVVGQILDVSKWVDFAAADADVAR